MDNNTGTQNCPLLSINQGIANAVALAQPKVFVATNFAAGAASLYTEDIVVPANVMIEGKYNVTGAAGAFTWNRPSPGVRTSVQNTSALGLRFAAGVTRTAGIDGLQIRSVAPAAPPPTIIVIGITDASPTLRDFGVIGTINPPFPVTEYGVSVLGTGVNRPSPAIVGSVAGVASFIGGIRGINDADGLRVELAHPDIANLSISEIFGGNAAGTHLINGANTTFSLGSSSVLSGTNCYGVLSSGDASGVVFDNVSAAGCSSSGLASSAVTTFGVVFDNCPAAGVGAAPVFRNSRGITGGTASTPPPGTSVAVGVQASDGCALDIQGNQAITGAVGNTNATTQAEGVRCTFKGLVNAMGADAPCRVLSNGQITGSASNAVQYAHGLSCVGTCATKNAACTGSCAEVKDNKPGPNGGLGITAGAGPIQYNLYVEQSNPSVQRNAFSSPPVQPAGPGCTDGKGGLLLGSGAFVANNLFIGPACTTPMAQSVGLELAAAQRSGDSSIPSALVHSNTILAYANSGIAPPVQSGVRLAALPGGALNVVLGSFINNIIQAGSSGTRVFAFEESSANVDPVVLNNNDYFIAGPIAGMAPLYLDEGTTTLSMTSQIDMLMGASNSQTVNPGFIAGSLPHIMAGSSMVRGIGTSAGGGPSDDYDAQLRPIPLASLPDIGADETQ